MQIISCAIGDIYNKLVVKDCSFAHVTHFVGFACVDNACHAIPAKAPLGVLAEWSNTSAARASMNFIPGISRFPVHTADVIMRTRDIDGLCSNAIGVEFLTYPI